MKSFAAAAFLTAIAITPALADAGMSGPGAHNSVCLETYLIDHTKVVDPRTVLFYMKGGKVWRNTLNSACSDLLFNGFVYVARNDEICSNMQTIRVLRSGEICTLGPFTPETTPPKH